MKNLLGENPQVKILTEYFPEALESSGFGREKYLKLLKSYGYKFKELRERISANQY